MSTVELKVQSNKLVQLQLQNGKEKNLASSQTKTKSVTAVLRFPKDQDIPHMVSAIPSQVASQMKGVNKLSNGQSSAQMVLHVNGNQGFMPLESSSTITNGMIKLVNSSPGKSQPQLPAHGAIKRVVQVDDRDMDRKRYVSIAPAPSTHSNPKTTTKVVMSTVAKRVPLVSTAPGNGSKLPLAASKIVSQMYLQESAASVVPISSSESVRLLSAITSSPVPATSSFLAARLTAPVMSTVTSKKSGSNEIVSETVCKDTREVPSTSDQQQSVVSAVTTSVGSVADPVGTDATSEVNVGAAHSTQTMPLVAGGEWVLSTAGLMRPVASVVSAGGPAGLPSMECRYQSDPIVSKPPCKKGQSVKAVLSYEKGITRYVSVEQRTVTLVDVGMQVSIPEELIREQSSHVMVPSTTSDNLLGEVSQSGPTVMKGPSQPAAPLKPGQFVTLNTKTGRVVVAVRKDMFNTTGPKTVMIGGKPVKVQMKGSLGQVTTSVNSKPGHQTLPTGSSGIKINELPVFSSQSVSTPVVTSAPLMTGTSTTPSKQWQPPVSIMSTPPKDGDTVVLPLDSPIRDSPNKVLSDSPAVRTLPNTTSLLIMIPNSLRPAEKLQRNEQTELPVPPAGLPSPPAPLSPVPLLRQLLSDSATEYPIPAVNGNDPKSLKRAPTQSEDSPPSKLKCPDSYGEGTSLKRTDLEVPSSESCHRIQSSKSHLKSATSALYPVRQKELNGRETQERAEKDDVNHVKGKENVPVGEMEYQLHIEDDYQQPTTPLWSSMDTIFTPSNEQQSVPKSRDAKQEANLLVKSALMDFKNCLVPDDEGNMPIHVAVEYGDETAVKRQCIVLAARKAPVDILNGRDESALQVALFCGFSSIVVLLLKSGADPNVVDKDGNTTLHLAVLYANEVALDAILKSKQLKTPLDTFNDEGFTALHIAAQHGKVRELNLLVRHGACIDLGDAKSGRTALYHSVERRQYKAQQALVKHGADMTEPSFTGTTPLAATRNDMFSQLTIGQNQVGEIIDTDVLLHKTHRRKKVT